MLCLRQVTYISSRIDSFSIVETYRCTISHYRPTHPSWVRRSNGMVTYQQSGRPAAPLRCKRGFGYRVNLSTAFYPVQVSTNLRQVITVTVFTLNVG
jgi:hypothetical protein